MQTATPLKLQEIRNDLISSVRKIKNEKEHTADYFTGYYDGVMDMYNKASKEESNGSEVQKT